MQHNYNYKQLNNKKKAFTLIELLIVIAIIGILFIVLVSRVDFATDKAKATGVQTDFRSFQMAFEQVARENAGFNTFGFDMGDNGGGVAANSNITINGKTYTYTNADKDKGDGIRNSYDEGDTNLDGKNVSETWTGRKVYTETWTDVWTLVKPGTTGYNADAIFALESAINKNLDPKLHITIAADGKITMANQARDPWKNEYHGYYITNAETDKGDRGAIVMYSNGANGKWGSAHVIENGVVTVGVPGNNIDGKDDYAIHVIYTYKNGFGETSTGTGGFSNQLSDLTGTLHNEFVIPGSNITIQLPNGVNKDDVVYDESNNSLLAPVTTPSYDVIEPVKLPLVMGSFQSSVIFQPATITYVPAYKVEIFSKLPNSDITTKSLAIIDLSGISTVENFDGPFVFYEEDLPKASFGVLLQCDTPNGSEGLEGGHVIHSFLKATNENASVEDVIYALAYQQNSSATATNVDPCPVHGRAYSIRFFEWNGTSHVEKDISSEINAITSFTETKTTVEYVQQVTEGCIDTRYTYVPYGEFQYEESMTWAEWIASEYNTISQNVVIKTKDYEDVPLNSIIDASQEYAFVQAGIKGKWQFLEAPNVTLGENGHPFYEEVAFTDGTGRQMHSMWLTGSDIGYGAGLFPMTVYKPSVGWIDGCDIIDFGEKTQSVTQEFYEWLLNNAVLINN